jgi:hypothetical protein
MHINSKSTCRHMAYPEDGDPLWPPVESFDLGTVVTWAKQTSLQNGPLAQTRIERALAAYSHLIAVTWMNSGEVLFRAMQGLEAFYCEGVGDLRRQLSEKSRLWLGPWDDKRNIVGQLYDLRSAFVHGSASLTYKGHESRAWETDEQEMFKFDAGVKLATRLLIATLQRCVKENVFDVNWSYAYTTRVNPQ